MEHFLYLSVKPQYKSTWEARGRGEESCVSVAASSGCDSKQTRLVVAHHPGGCPCTFPSPESSRGMWVHQELGEGLGYPRETWSWTVGSPRVRSRMKCQTLGDLMLGMWGIGGEVRRMLLVTYWEGNSLHLQLQAGNDEVMVIRVQLVGRTNMKQGEIRLLDSYLCHMK